MKLNEEQKKVVYSNERFLFLLASAGSGKTRVIVERIKHLVSKGVDPKKILAITFTKKASLEMQERIENKEVNIHTFHQFCFKRLKEDFKITFEMFETTESPFKKEELLAIANYKNSLFKLVKPKTYDKYQDYLSANKLKDFDDLLLDFIQQIKIANRYKFDYIFIDEFQDTNILQYELLEKITGEETSVLAVGDPDQSIYSFRGSDSELISKFIINFKAKLHTLSINYRSVKNITTLANSLIKRNNRLFKKELIPCVFEELTPYHFKFKNEKKEIFFLINFVKTLKKSGVKESEIAILFRNNFRVNNLKKELLLQDVHHQISTPNKTRSQNGIQLMTIHKAKGLEFDCVIIVGLEKGLLPSTRKNDVASLDEERRLMFVAMTRAKKYLYFTSIEKQSNQYAYKTSCFIRESGIKTLKIKDINDIILLGDFNER